MFRLRDLVGLAVILAVLIVPEETSPSWIRLALLGVAIAIVLEVAWEIFRDRANGRR